MPANGIRRWLVGLAVLAAAALFLVGMAGTPAAHADEPGDPTGPQAIVVGDQLTISANTSVYRVDDWIHVCYTVPAASYIQITDHQGGNVRTILSGYGDGAGDCFWGQVTPPFGQECLRIRYWFPYGGSTTRQTCFQVILHLPF